jgi:hypothetical protein
MYKLSIAAVGIDRDDRNRPPAIDLRRSGARAIRVDARPHAGEFLGS